MKKLVTFFLLVSFLSSPVVFADDPMRKLGRGVANIITGPFEIVNETIIGARDQNLFVAPFRGVFFGTAKGLYRMVIGVVEGFTFLIPVPKGYAPIMEPENSLDTLAELTWEISEGRAPSTADEETPTVEERAAQRDELMEKGVERLESRREGQ